MTADSSNLTPRRERMRLQLTVSISQAMHTSAVYTRAASVRVSGEFHHIMAVPCAVTANFVADAALRILSLHTAE